MPKYAVTYIVSQAVKVTVNLPDGEVKEPDKDEVVRGISDFRVEHWLDKSYREREDPSCPECSGSVLDIESCDWEVVDIEGDEG